MTEPSPAVAPDRLRTMRRIVAGAGLLGTAFAVVVGVAGGSGRAGLAVLLLFVAVGAAAGALYGVATALLDEARNDEVRLSRIGWSFGLFFLAAAVMAMVAAVGG